MDVSFILKDLNEQQRAAVTAPNCNALVLAGAGSGKTRVLIHRLAWLLNVEGCSSDSLLAVTFTNKAAKEMRARIRNMCGESAGRIWCGTFHAIANRVLHIHWQAAGLAKNFSISDRADQLAFIKRILKQSNQSNIASNKLNPKDLRGKISHWKEEGLRSKDVVVGNNYLLEQMLLVYELYEKTAMEESMVDFSELLLRLYELLRDNPDILTHYRRRFRHILVDEFQDTNKLQIGIIRLLQSAQESKYRNYVMAVGDEDQSIYSWRGANINNILKFNEMFPDAKIYRLEQNYRSTSAILEAANHLIEHNKGRLGKKLWTSNRDQSPIKFYRAPTDQAEAAYVVDRVEGYKADGGSLNDCAVLYRVNAQSRILEDTLTRANLPYRIYGGLRFYDRAEVKNALAYLRLTVFPEDNVSFARVLNLPPRGLGVRSLEKITSWAERESVSYLEAARRMLAALPARQSASLRQFLGLLEQIGAAVREHSLAEAVAHSIKLSGLLSYYESLKDEGKERQENLRELINAVTSIAERGETAMSAFLNAAALEAGGEKEEAERKEALQLMTLHSAKGLEFPMVFMVGMEENIFPHENSALNEEELEEERRLCYVGITRARQQLHLLSCELRTLYGRESYNTVSRFVEEIPQSLIEEIGVSVDAASELQANASPSLSHIKKGERVLHSAFGYGVVTNIEGSGASARVEVDFENEGNKWLVLKYAELEKL